MNEDLCWTDIVVFCIR